MSSSRSGRVEDTYETQNDQRLDELHSKIRTIRGVRITAYPISLSLTSACLLSQKITTDMHTDVEAQNLLLDESVCFSTLS